MIIFILFKLKRAGFTNKLSCGDECVANITKLNVLYKFTT
jgi:hypothetical protein